MKKERWTYKTKASSGQKYGLGVASPEIYFKNQSIEYFTGSGYTISDARNLGDFWMYFLKKLEKILPYQPEKYKNWLDWYLTIRFSADGKKSIKKLWKIKKWKKQKRFLLMVI